MDIEDDVIVDTVSIRGESDRCIITISHRVYRYDRLLSDTHICYNVTPGEGRRIEQMCGVETTKRLRTMKDKVRESDGFRNSKECKNLHG